MFVKVLINKSVPPPVANSGRVDRMFQVTPDQEKTMLIGDMLSDGLLIVELLPSPVSTPCAESHPCIHLSPGDSPESSLDLDTASSEKRKLFGRNSSYGERLSHHIIGYSFSE